MKNQGWYDEQFEVLLSVGTMHVLADDIAAEWLELGKEAFYRIGAFMPLMIHMASMVNHAYGYHAMNQVNVESMV